MQENLTTCMWTATRAGILDNTPNPLLDDTEEFYDDEEDGTSEVHIQLHWFNALLIEHEGTMQIC